MNLHNTHASRGSYSGLFIFLKTTTHSRAAPAGIFASCADISDLPKIEDADWQSSVNKAEQQGQTFNYAFDAEKRDHLEGKSGSPFSSSRRPDFF